MGTRRIIASLVGLSFLAAALPAVAAETQSLDLGREVSLEVVKVKAGTFTMGSPESEAGHKKDEASHEVTIAEDFFIGKTPVTRAQFARFAADAKYKTEAEAGNSGGFGIEGGKLVQKKEFNWRNPGFEQTDDHPVVLVTLKDAQAFCTWLGKRTHRKVTLPTEAQWEYACRAGTNSRFYSGDTDDNARAIAWFDANSDHTTHPVAQKAANAWGICDMSGNVWEWCSDIYGPYQKGGPVVGDLDKPRNILRGGSFLRPISDVRSAARYRNTPGSRNADNGFRIVASEIIAAPATPPAILEQPPTPAPHAGTSAPPPAFAPQRGPITTSNLPSTAGFSPSEPATDVRESMDWTPGSTTVRRTVTYSTTPQVAQFESGPFAGGFPVGCVFAAIFIVAIIIVIFQVIRAILNSNSSSTNWNTGNPTFRHPMPRLVDDGFWIDSSVYQPGHVISYTYYTDDGPVTAQFTVHPNVGGNGQFIYTGVRPVNVVMGAYVGSQIASHTHYSNPTAYSTSQPSPPPPPTPARTESHFGGFPSAY